MNTIAFQTAVAEDLPGIVSFLPGREFSLAAFAVVRDDQARAPVAAVCDDRGAADGVLGAGQPPCLAAVPVAGQGLADGDHEPSVCPIAPGERIDALCLTLLRDRAKWHGEAFHFARQKFAEEAEGTPIGELATGLTAVVLDDTGNDEEYPPSAQAKLIAVDAALDRVRTRAQETGEPLMDRPHSAALLTLPALTAEDREAFDAELADLLARHTTPHGPAASPSTLLPLVPIALAALAYRTLGWSPAVRTDYLPHALITGFETRGPRVGGFGRNRRPDAVAALAEGPLVVERPACEWTVDPQTEAMYEEDVQEAFTAADGEPLAVWRLGSVMGDQERLFKWPRSTPRSSTQDARRPWTLPG